MLIIQSEEGTSRILNNLESTSELMVAEMDYAEVEIRSLYTYPVLGHYKYLKAHLKNARPVVNSYPHNLKEISFRSTSRSLGFYTPFA